MIKFSDRKEEGGAGYIRGRGYFQNFMAIVLKIFQIVNCRSWHKLVKIFMIYKSIIICYIEDFELKCWCNLDWKLGLDTIYILKELCIKQLKFVLN